MTIEIIIALALYAIMILLIFMHRKMPVPWHSIRTYFLGALIYLVVASLVSVFNSSPEPFYQTFIEPEFYAYALPILIIAAYLDRKRRSSEPLK